MFFKNRNSFLRKFFDPKILQLFENDPKKSDIYGEQKTLTVLSIGFFLQESESFEKFVEFYAFCVDELLAQGATINRLNGLQILAYYNYPKEIKNHVEKACETASKLAIKAKEKKLIMRTAINSGKAIIGCVGSANLVSHVVIGDTVSLTEEMLKLALPAESGIIVSNFVKDSMNSENFKFDLMQTFRFSETNITIYELVLQ